MARPEGPLLFGVDLGGTKLRAALADGSGTVLAELVEPTVRGTGAAIVARVAAVRHALEARAGAPPGATAAAGIGLPLAVDPATGASWSHHNVPGLGAIDVPAALRDALGIPLALDNDANCAALGEGRAGAAVGLADFAVVAIGTGIGCGMVAGGVLLRGAHGGTGEIGFLPLGSDPWTAANRAVGAYEAAVAGPALDARIRAAQRAGSSLAGLAAAAAAGDDRAARILDDEARLVALGIAAVAAVVDPALVVLSGGVGAVAGLLPPVRSHVATLCPRPPRVVTGALGERAPLVGALAIAADLAAGRPAGGG